jgi:predicted phage baseplate assembly protein
MSLPVPNLDDRTFQDLVNEARLRIPEICPEWTDHNVSDPGIALIELFAWMTESLIYRTNQVPDRNYIKFMDLVGIQLKPAIPSEAEITFRLSTPASDLTIIPPGTEVATVRTETEEAIVFTTTNQLEMEPPMLDRFILSRDGESFRERMELLREWTELRNLGIDTSLQENGDSFPVFEQVPEVGNALYLGYTNNLAGVILALDLECVEAEGSGVNPNNPPLSWEYWDSQLLEWSVFNRSHDSSAWLESDMTRGLNISGRISLHIPRTAGRTVVNGEDRFWIRCVSSEPKDRQGMYVTSPQIRSILSYVVGGICQSSNFTWSVDETLGYSNGKPGQAYDLFHKPMLRLEPGEPVEVQRQDGNGWETWEVVEDFGSSGPDDRHVTCDAVFSQISFGPIIKTSNGSERSLGAIPKVGLQIRVPAYRYGGGPGGNVGAGTLSVLKSSIPYVSEVTNRLPARGGANPETLDEGRLRTPQVFKTRDRAVTKEDYEYLAKEASPFIARASCIERNPYVAEGRYIPQPVQILLVPQHAKESYRPEPNDLTIPTSIIETVTEYLDQRRLIGTPLIVTEAEYLQVSLTTNIKLIAGADEETARRLIEDVLYSYIHPGLGGDRGSGWEFGKDLHIPDIVSRIQAVPEVEYTLSAEAYQVNAMVEDPATPEQHITVLATETLCSGNHKITFI